MNLRAIALLLAGLCVGTSGLLPRPALSQSDSAQPSVALDATPVGKVMSATGIVHIEHAAGVVVQVNAPASRAGDTKPGDLIYRGDLIRTGADGALGITFADGTSFNVTGNARMEVNEFVYDPNGHSNSTLLTLSKGTFTWIAGEIAHTGHMKVDTPAGVVGIRGTAPRVEILNDGSVKFSTLIEKKVEPK